MAKRLPRRPRQQSQHYLVLCEGHTEVGYLSKQLEKQRYYVKKSKYTNAQKLVEIDIGNNFREWSLIFCVFDRDSESNTKPQLQSANQFIKNWNGKCKLVRVFSNPCFEVALWFSSSTTTRSFNGCAQVEIAIAKQIGTKYSKDEIVNGNLIDRFDFNNICENTKLNYDKLGISDDNWLNNDLDAYSEIFKLREI